MNVKKIKAEVRKLLHGLTEKKKIGMRDSLREELLLDSMSLVTLLIQFEDTFSVTLDVDDLNPFMLETVSDVVALAEKYVGDRDE